MLAKQNRLNRNDFINHFKSKKRFQSPVATLIISPHKTFHGAVVVSKKVSNKAVVRNKLRRRAYAQLYNAFKDKKVGVYILVLKPAIAALSKKQQHNQIKNLIADSD